MLIYITVSDKPFPFQIFKVFQEGVYPREYLQKVAPGLLSQSTLDWMAVCNQQATDNLLEWREPNRPRRL
jgi:hypothetical protein